MSYYYLPKIYPNIKNSDIEIIFKKEQDNHEDYLQSLNTIKNEIRQFKNNNVIKKILSPYSILSSLIVKNKDITYDYLLFTEIFNLTKIIFQDNIKTFNFYKNDIEIIKYINDINPNSNCKHYTCNFYEDTPENIQYDIKMNNVLDNNNYNHIKNNYKTFFDFISIMDINEDICINYYYLKVFLSLYMLKPNSNFIFKIPNIYSKENVDLLFIVSNFFDRTIIIKPNITNYFKNDKYICCKKLSNVNNSLLSNLCDIYLKLIKKNTNKISGLLKLNVPTTFISKIDECNSITSQNLLDNFCYLHNVCKMCDKISSNDKLNEINEKNKIRCQNWCSINGIEYNE